MKTSPSHTAPAAKSCTTAPSPAKKTHWKAGHKQQCAQFAKEINTFPNERSGPSRRRLVPDEGQGPQASDRAAAQT